jgi:hypothetical protein
MVAGRIEPRDVERLLQGFRDGWARGLGLAGGAPDLRPEGEAFLTFAGAVPVARGHEVLSGRPWQAEGLRAKAAALAAEGRTVTLILLSPTALYHRVDYMPEGYWLQTGGLFGRSLRSDPLVRYWRFADRVAREVERVRPVRHAAFAP